MNTAMLAFALVFMVALPQAFAWWGGSPYYGGYGYPGWGGSSSSNALGGGQIGYGNINSDNTAFTNGGMGFAHGNTNAQGYGANIFSAASSNSNGLYRGWWRRR